MLFSESRFNSPKWAVSIIMILMKPSNELAQCSQMPIVLCYPGPYIIQELGKPGASWCLSSSPNAAGWDPVNSLCRSAVWVYHRCAGLYIICAYHFRTNLFKTHQVFLIWWPFFCEQLHSPKKKKTDYIWCEFCIHIVSSWPHSRVISDIMPDLHCASMFSWNISHINAHHKPTVHPQGTLVVCDWFFRSQALSIIHIPL